MRAIFPVESCKLSAKSASGFTFIELLVVLSILGVMVSLVTPNFSSLLAKDSAQHEAMALQNAMQKVINQSWLEGRNSFIELNRDERQLIPWLRKNGLWQTQSPIYMFDSNLNYSLEVNINALTNAQKSLSMARDTQWVVFSNGEYLPFSLQIEGPESAYTLTGDGINDVQIEP